MLNSNNGCNMCFWTKDRKENFNGAVAWANGYQQLPTGVYFNSSFSITVWVYPNNVQNMARIIDCGNGPASNNVILILSEGTSNRPVLHVYLQDILSFFMISNIILPQNTWSFLAVTFNGSSGYMYINGNQVAQKNTKNSILNLPLNVERSKCYVGRSNWNADGRSQSSISELAFYNQDLSQTFLKQIMRWGPIQSNKNCKNLLLSLFKFNAIPSTYYLLFDKDRSNELDSSRARQNYNCGSNLNILIKKTMDNAQMFISMVSIILYNKNHG